jgi:hypothetical protein
MSSEVACAISPMVTSAPNRLTTCAAHANRQLCVRNRGQPNHSSEVALSVAPYMPRAAQWLCMAHAARRHALHGASIHTACILRPYTFRKGRLPTVVSGEHTCAHTGQCRSTYSAKTGLAISMKYSLRCGATAVSELARACRLGLARCMLQPYCAPLRRAAANRVWCHAAAAAGPAFAPSRAACARADASAARLPRCCRPSPPLPRRFRQRATARPCSRTAPLQSPL